MVGFSIAMLLQVLAFHPSAMNSSHKLVMYICKIAYLYYKTQFNKKKFTINLPFTAEQYKVDNIANFVYYGKTLITNVLAYKISCFFLNWHYWYYWHFCTTSNINNLQTVANQIKF